MTESLKERLSLRPVTDDDLEFLYRVYASTREEEMTLTGWNEEKIADFLGLQFQLQHTQYIDNYRNATFEIILLDGEPVGRLYVDRREKEIRIIDIALLTPFRCRGIGSVIMNALSDEADRSRLPLNLHVEINNPALGLYRQLGFKKVREVYPYYFMERLPSPPD